MNPAHPVMNRNRGFSLVELIIVIAIMAILVAILAPQFLKFVKKSRKAADIENADEIVKVLTVAMMDPDDEDGVQLQSYISHIVKDTAQTAKSRNHVLFYITDPRAYAAGDDVSFHDYTGMFPDELEEVKKSIKSILEEGLGLKNGRSNIKVSDFEKSKRDMWIICTDSSANLFVYVGAANGENWIEKSSSHPYNKTDREWFMVYPEATANY